MWLWVLVVVIVGACGRIGFETEASGDDAVVVDGSRPGETLDVAATTCAAQTIASCPEQTLAAAVFTNMRADATISTEHGLASAMCGSGGSTPEVTYVVTPATAGNFMISITGGSGFNPYYILDGCCGGAELQCGTITTPTFLRREAGEVFTIVVEGNTGATTSVMVAGLL